MSLTKPFHVNYLAEEFSRRSQGNPYYSLRSFARDLEVAPSWLSDFLSLKKGLSRKAAERFTEMLGLSASEAKLFILSAQANHARSAKDREEAQQELKKIKKSSSYKMKPKDFVLTGAWYHQAILELTEIENFSHTEQEIAQRLRLPLVTIKRAISDLQDANLLTFEDGKMKAVFNETESSVDLPSSAICKYHEQILQKGLAALREQSILQREYSSVTFAFDSERMTEAKQALRKFQKEFTEEFYTNSKEKNSVYQFSFQFFRIDHNKGSN